MAHHQGSGGENDPSASQEIAWQSAEDHHLDGHEQVVLDAVVAVDPDLLALQQNVETRPNQSKTGEV